MPVSLTLSSRTKEAIKTALAMTIAYGIALSQNWERPYWAGFAVAFISLTSIGASLNKAVLRMCGTLLAFCASLTFIALFPQERWSFFLIFSLYLMFCSYMMSGSRHAYFWQVAGFVCAIICMDAGPDPVHAFTTATLRVQETGLGILVYSLVSIFLWPSYTRDFRQQAADVLAQEQRMFKACGDLLLGRGDQQQVTKLIDESVQAKANFDQLLNSAELESREVWQLRAQWHDYQAQLAQLSEGIGRWHETFAELQSLNMPLLLPDLEALLAELDQRLTQIGKMFAGTAPKRAPQSMALPADKNQLEKLSHVQRAAVTVVRGEILALDQVSASMFQRVAGITGFETAPAPPVVARQSLVADPDRLACALRYLVFLWLVFLTVIYVPDLPGGFGVVAMGASFGIALVNMPQIPVSSAFLPAAGSVLFAGFLYIFVMPHLSSFKGLGAMLFSVTFAICYLLAAPAQVLSRALALSILLSVISVSNPQSYNFLVVTTNGLTLVPVFLALAITAYFPFNFMPERVFLRLLRRFFRSSEYLTDALQWGRSAPTSRLQRLRYRFHQREVATIPSKLASWAPHIDPAKIAGAEPAQVRALVTSVQSLAIQLQGLQAARTSPQARFLVQQLLPDFRAWRLDICALLQQLGRDPGASGDGKLARVNTDQVLTTLESHIKEALESAPAGHFTEADAENFYRVLGAYRALSAALLDYTDNASVIKWAPWREERFA